MNDRKVTSVIKKHNNDPSQVVSVLQDIQSEFLFLPKEILEQVSRQLDIPLSRVYAVATFFRAFSLKPRGKHLINVCLGTACHVRNAEKILERLELNLNVKKGQTTKDNKYTLETVNCMGACALGPVMKIDQQYHGQMSPDKVTKILVDYNE